MSDLDQDAAIAALSHYAPGAVWDELVTGERRLRPHWEPLIGYLSQLDPTDIGELRDEAARLLRQNGVGYTIYHDPRAGDRPWPLDLIPLLIPAAEWRTIEAGVIQRARLLNAILADIYGGQRMVGEGRLPPSLLHANPSFLRPSCGIEPPGGVFLHLYAVDLARSPDGQWWVLADRMQAPSGAGYALENRSVIGRVLADCMSAAAVLPIAPFFASLRDNLSALAPVSSGSLRPPRVVLLTPGPYNETYFEHAYLARQLDLSLVEGADLTVRGRRVFLKTLNGLEPVDVVLRRLDDDFCDPLELRPESTLGVAGLAEAARAGTVTIANALGSGVLEGMAFKPFLPGLSQALLGETLALADVASWWCGGDEERRFVVDHLDRLVIKPAFPTVALEPAFGAELSQAGREALAARIAARPLDFVGQERVELSTVPAQQNGRLVPRPLVLRVFVAASGAGFVALPGGLTRISAAAGAPIVSMQQGGGCKDTWITGAPLPGPRHEDADISKVITLRTPGASRSSADRLASRTADGLFWVGRYAERVYGSARLLRSLLLGITDAAQPWTLQEVEPALALAEAFDLLPALDLARGRVAALKLVPLIHAAVLDHAHASGLPANLHRLTHAASGVRDHLPHGCWQVIAALGRSPALRANRPVPSALLLRLDEVVTLEAALWGMVDDMMQRDAGWRFLDLGKRLERAINHIAILRAASARAQRLAGEARGGDEEALLAATVATVWARSARPGALDGARDHAAMLSAMLLDADDPFGLAFQVAAIAAHLRALPRPGADASEGVASVARALDLIGGAHELLSNGLGGAPVALATLNGLLAPLGIMLREISDLLTRAYFTHAFARPA
ncbi:MAG TPA: circularly permuted type 2 ATP-grasp protein [Stellaceae bacterium]|nr:circularly permuted type 2 ATP-grasp protein [Stellaceae bacterium]